MAAITVDREVFRQKAMDAREQAWLLTVDAQNEAIREFATRSGLEFSARESDLVFRNPKWRDV